MSILIREITAKSILSKSGIPGADYCINPYVGCSHACKYCYASFMKKYTGHTEEWGSFVDVKINAPEILAKQLKRSTKGSIIISSVSDAYQPAEAQYKLTRKCLEILLNHDFSIDILTKSPLVLRDLELLEKFKDIEVGITITTDNENIKKVFEPYAPSVETRIDTLKKLHGNGIRTYVFIGPVLPMNPEALCDRIKDYVDYVFIDRMNYVSKTINIYKKLHLQQWLEKGFIEGIRKRLTRGFNKKQLELC
jgi:DNA repair photolyase